MDFLGSQNCGTPQVPFSRSLDEQIPWAEYFMKKREFILALLVTYPCSLALLQFHPRSNKTPPTLQPAVFTVFYFRNINPTSFQQKAGHQIQERFLYNSSGTYCKDFCPHLMTDMHLTTIDTEHFSTNSLKVLFKYLLIPQRSTPACPRCLVTDVLTYTSWH